MDLLIHIGMPKTGTTTIQYMLRDHAEAFAKRGILYPLLPGIGHAHTHLGLLHEGDRAPDFLRDHYAKDPRSFEEIGQDILCRLKDKVVARPPGIHTVVLSSELWFTRPHFAQNADFADFIAGFDNCRILCYVRQNSTFYLSALQQSLKARHELLAPKFPRYRTIIERLEQRFDVQVREFSREALDGGDVVQDFCRHVLGLEPPAEATDLKANTSFSAAGMEVMRQWRAALPQDRWGKRNKETNAFERALSAAEATLGAAEPPRLNDNLAAWLDQPTEDLRYLRERYDIDLGAQTVMGPVPTITPETPLEDIITINWAQVAALKAYLAPDWFPDPAVRAAP